MKSFYIEEKVLKTSPYFIFGCTGEELKKHIKRVVGIDIEAPTDSVGTQITTKDKKNRRVRILWMRRIPDTPMDIAVLVHEIFHLTVMICADKGVPIIPHIQTGECGDEAAAYLMEFFYYEVMRRLAKKAVPKKKKKPPHK